MAEMLPATEEFVAMANIQLWLDGGYSDEQAILRWNHPAGVTYGCSAGVNSHGVAWDSCKYKRAVLALLHG